eukprot:UN10934
MDSFFSFFTSLKDTAMSSTRNKVITAGVVAGSFLTVYHIISHHHTHQHHHNDNMFDHIDAEEVAQYFEDPKGRPFPSFIPKIISNLNVKIKGAKVVDIGAGTGVLMKHFTKVIGVDGTYIALELSKSFFDHINSSISKQNIKNAIVINNTVDSFCLPLDFNGKIDVFVCLNVWHHVEDKKSVLEEIYNNLQNGGAFMLLDFKKFTDEERKELNLPNLFIFKMKFILYTIISSLFGHKLGVKKMR